MKLIPNSPCLLEHNGRQLLALDFVKAYMDDSSTRVTDLFSDHITFRAEIVAIQAVNIEALHHPTGAGTNSFGS